MIMTTVLVSLEALRVFLTPQTMRSEGPVLGVALFAIALTAALVILQTVAAKRSGSLIVKADRAHYLGDFALNLAVVLSALGAARGYTIADPLLALVAAGWIAYQARGVLVRAVDQLMDRELDDETRQAILEAAQGVAGADRVRALRTRMAGSRPYVSFHLEMDPDLTLLTSHHIALEAEERVKQVLPPGAEVLIHPDPLGWTEDHPDAMILDVMEQDAREP
jgi:ferrous-iron efflux pump FieF